MTSRYCSHHTGMWTIPPAAGGLQPAGASDLIGEPARIVVHLRPAIAMEMSRLGSVPGAGFSTMPVMCGSVPVLGGS